MTAEERARVFKALADPRRVDIVDLLARDGEMCGTVLSEALGISLPLLCHHWEVLVDAGILKKVRQGQLRVCSLDLDRVREATGRWKGAGRPASRKRKPSPARRRSRSS
jgi:DNA-binding transcriptional ArsR family regulator